MTSVATLPPQAEELRAYAYSYPHKSSYRRLSPPVALCDVWRGEDARNLSLYVHVPFCEMRCGFCNLFTQSQPTHAIVEAYLDTLLRQMTVVREAVPSATFSQCAVGGGTPTYLSAVQMERLFSAMERSFGVTIASLPTSVETSPLTATKEQLAVLKGFGVQRISMGVQSFVPREAQSFGRPQQFEQVHRALEAIRELDFPVLNIDLIYGGPEQTTQSLLQSLIEAMRFEPDELYLYPLYVRPGTGLGRVARETVPHRYDLYRSSRDFLLEQGYQQQSLRCFRWPDAKVSSSYTCQRDGMIGLGCGARSYTRGLHYATQFAVSQAGIRAILASWIQQSDHELSLATHGIRLSSDEQRRRFLIMSLLQREGMQLVEYENIFQSSPFDDIRDLQELQHRGWLDASTPGTLKMTEAGLANSDIAGPLLYSPSVRRCLEEFTRQ
jgi:oxygen-independent coproporphyrinogen-3 oxidase